MWRLEEGERGCVMTLLEIERAKQGWNILQDIEEIKDYIDRIKKDNVPLSLGFLDEDIREDARGKQIERYEQRIKELQKQFDEL